MIHLLSTHILYDCSIYVDNTNCEAQIIRIFAKHNCWEITEKKAAALRSNYGVGTKKELHNWVKVVVLTLNKFSNFFLTVFILRSYCSMLKCVQVD